MTATGSQSKRYSNQMLRKVCTEQSRSSILDVDFHVNQKEGVLTVLALPPSITPRSTTPLETAFGFRFFVAAFRLA